MPDFFDVVRSLRAQRALRPDPVPDELIERVLEAATRAPSAENLQPWVFVIVRDAEARRRLADLVRTIWDGGARDHARSRLSARLHADVDQWATKGMAAAPVVIVVCGDRSTAYEATLPSSIFPAVQNVLLAAHALGLGSLLSTLPLIASDELATILGLPDHVRAMAVIPIGWPERALPPARRTDFRLKTFRDRFGQPW